MNTLETAPTHGLTERLQLYARYLTVVAEQLEALSEERRERIAELEVERLAVETRLKTAPEPSPRTGSLDEFLNLGLAALNQESDSTRQLKERWALLDARTLTSARSVATPTIRGGRYPEVRELTSQFDRRL